MSDGAVGPERERGVTIASDHVTLLQRAGIEVGILSGRRSAPTDRRAAEILIALEAILAACRTSRDRCGCR